uniref:DBF4-type domain-containing protein n=1 Tax=Latimeria chalumnae TaxID=7897 RepID=H2ZWS3_LATCH
EQPGPGTSSMQSRQGYCSCCQVLYSNLEQHLYVLAHLQYDEHVQCSQHRQRAGSSRNRIVANSLMERFLQDVMHHHPVRYDDSRPTYDDLPSIKSPLIPNDDITDEYSLCEDDRQTVGTREEQSVQMPHSKNSLDSNSIFDWETSMRTEADQLKQDTKCLEWLKEAHIMLEDEKYETQLDSVLKVSQEKDEIEFKSEKNNIVEEKVPPSPYVPPTFVGKTWSQIMYEDDLKIEALVREFREGHFRSYFDSDSLANFGRRSSKNPKEAAAEALPSYDGNSDHSVLSDTIHKPAKIKSRSRTWCLASRCQYYDPLTNRILKMPPKGLIEGKSKKKLPCVRQLFRSLSPDINMERQTVCCKTAHKSSPQKKGKGSISWSGSARKKNFG